MPEPIATTDPMLEFKRELTDLINRHSIENYADMPDFIMAQMICDLIRFGIGPRVKATLRWYGVMDKISAFLEENQ